MCCEYKASVLERDVKMQQLKCKRKDGSTACIRVSVGFWANAKEVLENS